MSRKVARSVCNVEVGINGRRDMRQQVLSNERKRGRRRLEQHKPASVLPHGSASHVSRKPGKLSDTPAYPLPVGLPSPLFLSYFLRLATKSNKEWPCEASHIGTKRMEVPRNEPARCLGRVTSNLSSTRLAHGRIEVLWVNPIIGPWAMVHHGP